MPNARAFASGRVPHFSPVLGEVGILRSFLGWGFLIQHRIVIPSAARNLLSAGAPLPPGLGRSGDFDVQNHVGTAASAVRRPRRIGPLVFQASLQDAHSIPTAPGAESAGLLSPVPPGLATRVPYPEPTLSAVEGRFSLGGYFDLQDLPGTTAKPGGERLQSCQTTHRKPQPSPVGTTRRTMVPFASRCTQE
jgi:hypothetical protein